MKALACSICVLLAPAFETLAATPTVPVAAQTANQTSIRSKLETILIPEISFRDAPIADVIKSLDEAAIANDPDKTGINILLMDADNKTKLTMSLRKISLKSALKLVAQMANLTVNIEDGGIALRKPVPNKEEPKAEPAAPVYPPAHFGHGPSAQKTHGK